MGGEYFFLKFQELYFLNSHRVSGYHLLSEDSLLMSLSPKETKTPPYARGCMFVTGERYYF